MAEHVFLAVDLGASSGRVVAGRFEQHRWHLDEVHRFTNGPIPFSSSLHWDVLALWQEIQHALRLAAARYGDSIRSLGVDTWGVDFALLGRDDVLLGNPHCYRDPRTQGVMPRVVDRLGQDTIFAETGLQFMPINTLYQLVAMREARSPLLDMAESFLMMPDLFHWLLTGVKANESTNASTTQFYNPTTGAWSHTLFQRLDLPTAMLGRLIPPGTKLGTLRAEVARETGLSGVEVIVPGTHDTASAVVAVPARSEPGAPPDWCYISSGTWSLMGVESPRPIINDICQRFNFTNEGGVSGTTRVLKNVTGLWLLQECRRVWNQHGKSYDWETLNQLAADEPPLAHWVDPDDATFQAPGDMPAAIRAYCQRTGQSIPDSDGAVVRAAVQGIALKYRFVLERLEQLVGRRLETIHIVGGGTQNKQLCQAAADACGRLVLAGPIEATALGNLVVQAVARGLFTSLAEGRATIARSFPLVEYTPQHTATWDEVYTRFRAALSG